MSLTSNEIQMWLRRIIDATRDYPPRSICGGPWRRRDLRVSWKVRWICATRCYEVVAEARTPARLGHPPAPVAMAVDILPEGKLRDIGGEPPDQEHGALWIFCHGVLDQLVAAIDAIDATRNPLGAEA